MTRREEQILDWIRDNPMVSQQELAKRAGITRSSVAVHISNLMRKGLIKGKGYVLAEERYIVVVGGANIDQIGTPDTALIGGDSNPGRVTQTLGGVGRNIAENLCRLGFRTLMITALGSDANAERILSECKEIGLDLSNSLTVHGARTSTYLCLNDVGGDIVGAVSDMAIYEELTPAFLQSKLSLLNHAALVVMDANLPEESIRFLAEHCTAPLFADSVSVKKAGRLQYVLDKLCCIKPNRPEATLLTGVSINDYSDLPRAAEAFFELGLEQVMISLGANGVYINNGKDEGIIPCYASRVVNTTGCGDAFVAAAAAGFLEQKSLRDMARMGLAASSICAQADSAVSPAMSMEAIENVMNQYEGGNQLEA